jgi:ankyrin repeat protein
MLTNIFKRLLLGDLDDRLIIAVARGYSTDMVKALLEAGADVHTCNDMPLRWAAANGDTQTVKVLLEAGGGELLEAEGLATANGHTETLKVLHEHGEHMERVLSILTSNSAVPSLELE